MDTGIVILRSDCRRVEDAQKIFKSLSQSAVNIVAIEAGAGDNSPIRMLSEDFRQLYFQHFEFLFPTTKYQPLVVTDPLRVICYVQSKQDANALRAFRGECSSKQAEIRVCGPASTIFPLAAELELTPMPIVDFTGQEPSAWDSWPKNTIPVGIHLTLGTANIDSFITASLQHGFSQVFFWSWRNIISGNYLDQILRPSVVAVPQEVARQSDSCGTVIQEVSRRAGRNRMALVREILQPGTKVEIVCEYPRDKRGDIYALLADKSYILLESQNQLYVRRPE